MTHLSCFSGIGGIDLATDQAGFRTVGFIESNPFCQQVLRKNWKDVPIYDDVSTFDSTLVRGIDLVSGGFPCQDVSIAGKQDGIDGARSGLFVHLVRIISDIRPRFALLENVTGLITGGGHWQSSWTVGRCGVRCGLGLRSSVIGGRTPFQRQGVYRGLPLKRATSIA
jgi:DNA (cytosine-5)-methyltransferase 1